MPLLKKERNGFDCTIRSYDGAEIFKLISLFRMLLRGKNCNSKISDYAETTV